MRSVRIALFAAVVATLALRPSPSWPADAEIAISATTVEPEVLHTVTGRRVNFMKRVDMPVHVEFGWDPRQHQVYQVPATGPIWVIFNRPGTHPYTVHIYGVRTTTAIHGVVEVVEDPQHPWGVGTCPAVVMGDCLEP
jgi:hypothetical protein